MGLRCLTHRVSGESVWSWQGQAQSSMAVSSWWKCWAQNAQSFLLLLFSHLALGPDLSRQFGLNPHIPVWEATSALQKQPGSYRGLSL